MELKVTNKATLADRIGVLKHLQSIDNRLIELTRKKKTLLDTLEKRRTHILQEKELLAKKHTESKNFQKSVDGKELDLKCLEEEIKKLRGRLFQIKNNKEYSILLSEVGSREADKSVLEDEILSMFSKLEALHIEEKELSKKSQEAEKELTKHSNSVETEVAGLEKEIQEAQKQWRENAELLDSEAITQYRRLIEKDGIAVVEVDGEVCGGCNMSLTPQTINLLHRRQEIILCKNCGRILCLPE
jgi:predicted  nucleic acid-binding Zn-ribbon protein